MRNLLLQSHMALSIKKGCSEGSLTTQTNSFISSSTGGLVFQKSHAFLQQAGSRYFWKLPWKLASSMENIWQEHPGPSSSYLWFCQRHCMPVQSVWFWNKFPLFFSMLAVLHLSCWGETRSQDRFCPSIPHRCSLRTIFIQAADFADIKLCFVIFWFD